MNTQKTNIHPCPVCAGGSFRLRHHVREWTYYECNKCRASHIEPFLTPQKAAAIYCDETYYQNSDRDTGYDDYAARKSGLQRTFRSRNALLGDARWWQDRDIFEVGCGTGYYPQVLPSDKNVRYVGADLNPVAVKQVRALGFEAHAGDASVLPEGRVFDAVVLFDVIEHVIEPDSFISALPKRLKKGGRLLFTTPKPA
jgi:SAM-dependent methyltransferase